MPPLPFTPTYDFDNFATTFDDPFSYSAKAYEPTTHNHQDALNEESSPQELDNKLLGFSETIPSAAVVDEAGNFSESTMSAELYGMFFVAEDVFGGDNSGRPLELTCYRRNLWQCSGQVTLPRAVESVVDEQGRRLPLVELVANISAMESIEGKPTEIISIPWKSTNPPTGDEAKVATAPSDISIDLSTGQEVDSNRTSMAVSWKRLQFKHATANNGRRKGLQQHYVVQINLLGKVKSGELIKIAEVQSSPVIVRGRSPRNFDSRKDVPLTGEKRLERKASVSDINSASIKTERDHLQASMQRFQASNGQQHTDWPTQTVQPIPGHSAHPAKRMAISPTIARPPVPGWQSDSTSPFKNLHNGQQPRGSAIRSNGQSVPINLSLSEDERSPNRSNTDHQSPQYTKISQAVGRNSMSSPSEDTELLYEYFPLSVDDWYVHYTTITFTQSSLFAPITDT